MYLKLDATGNLLFKCQIFQTTSAYSETCQLHTFTNNLLGIQLNNITIIDKTNKK